MKRLTITARRLFVSYVLCGFGDPIFNVFINVYIWRQTQDPVFISVYNLFVFIALPVGFWVSMKLSVFPLWMRYAFGGITQVLAVALLFHTASFSLYTTALLGGLFGFTGGIYWFARNVLTWRLVRHSDRLFFASREWMISVVMSFFIPLSLGWAISLGLKYNLFEAQRAYEAISVVLIGVFSLAAIFVVGVHCFKKGLRKISFKLTPLWVRHRYIMFLLGVMQGFVVIVPLFAVFKFVGLEGAVGTIVSVASLVCGVVITILGNKAKPKHEKRIIFFHVVISIIGFSLFSILYNPLGVFVYYLLNALAGGLSIAISALVNDTLDTAVGKHVSVTYVFDQEVFLNAGRVGAIVLFLVLYFGVSTQILRYGMLIPAITQVFLYFMTKRQLAHLRA